MQAEQLNQRAEQLGNFVRSNMFKMVIGGSLIVLGVLMLIGSFAFSWVEAENFSDDDTSKASAMTIWMGGNDEVRTLNPNADIEDKGFGAVRLLDRFLIFLPIGAIALITLASAYMFFLKNLPWLTPLRTLLGLTIISCFLLLFPLIWESLSTNNWNNSELGAFVGSILADAYSTIEQQILGFLAFLIATTGLVLYMLNEQGALGASTSSPKSGTPKREVPPQARPKSPQMSQESASIPKPTPPASS